LTLNFRPNIFLGGLVYILKLLGLTLTCFCGHFDPKILTVYIVRQERYLIALSVCMSYGQAELISYYPRK